MKLKVLRLAKLTAGSKSVSTFPALRSVERAIRERENWTGRRPVLLG
jgi:hypothetical protein